MASTFHFLFFYLAGFPALQSIYRKWKTPSSVFLKFNLALCCLAEYLSQTKNAQFGFL
jgi:hypothetical protein